MKFSISSWHPFKWLTTAPMSKSQILCYDINERIRKLDDELLDIELKRIELEHQHKGLIAQLEFINEGGVETVFERQTYSELLSRFKAGHLNNSGEN